MDYIEELVRNYIHLPSQPASTGWYPILCKVCNDHGKKGPRAAFRFEDDGAAYHCFNCGQKGSYYPHFKTVPKDMEDVFAAFGIPEEEINKLRLATLQERDQSGQTIGPALDKRIIINPDELPTPDHFFPLQGAEGNWAEIARYYLEDRKIDPDSYPFFLSTGIPKQYSGPPSQKQNFIKAAQKWAKRLIIPIYKDNKLIYYQGRDLTGNALKKYESPSAPKDRVIYGFDQLFKHEDRPLYVVEGFFDAFHIGGVALLGNELTEPHIAWLNRSRRDKVYIPDRGVSGAEIARRALELGWKISFPVEPDSSDNIKDVSDAIVKYGQIYVHNKLREYTIEGIQAETTLRLYCKTNDKQRGTRANSRPPR